MTSDTGAAKSESTSKSTSSESSGKSDGGAPTSYSRGENQKPVTASYRDNWNLIFGRKTSTTKARSEATLTRAKTATRAKSKTVKVAKKAKAAKPAKKSRRR